MISVSCHRTYPYLCHCISHTIREWDMRRLPGGDPTARSICKQCLIVLAIPTAPREAITHASAVLIHLATASWRASHLYPTTLAGVLDTRETPEAPSTVGSGGPSGQSEAQGGYPDPSSSPGASTLAASKILGTFFPDGEESAQVSDRMSVLVASFMPLPPRSSLAVCHALVHVVEPPVLVASCDAEDRRTDRAVAGGGNLLLGPVLTAILSCGGAESELQMRFFALQVRTDRRGYISAARQSVPQQALLYRLQTRRASFFLVYFSFFREGGREGGRRVTALLWRYFGAGLAVC